MSKNLLLIASMVHLHSLDLSSARVGTIEVTSGIVSQPVATRSPQAPTRLLCLHNLCLQGCSALVNMLQLGQVTIEDLHDLRELCLISTSNFFKPRLTYRVIGLAVLCQMRGRIIDLLNHPIQVFAHLIEAVG